MVVGPVKPCTSLSCFAPFGPQPAHLPNLYTSAEGWTVQWYPASAVFSANRRRHLPRPLPTSCSSNSPSQVSPAEDGALSFVGLPVNGKSPDEIVTALQKANAPNAVPDYVLPGASVGYQPGYGDAWGTTRSAGHSGLPKHASAACESGHTPKCLLPGMLPLE